VAYDHVQVMPVKVLDSNGLGQDSDIILGVQWAADNGASVILMAFSNPGFSQSLQEAIDYAWSKNVVLVAAAGNDGSDAATFPAGDQGVMGVSATDQNDNLVASSNYGGSVFVAAPGVNIVGTYNDHSYVTWNGTSASAAMVAGTAALMRAVDPSLSNGVVVNRIARTADAAGTQSQTGNGRLNVARAVADTSTDAIQPAGTAPVGGGGPFVGPYKIAATLSLNPISGSIGTTVNVSGGGGSSSSSVTIKWDGTTVTTCSTNNGGNIQGTCQFTVPAGASVGAHTVAASGGLVATAAFTVIGPAAKLAFTPQPSSSSTGGTNLAIQPAVTIQDSAGNTVSSDSSTQVILAISAGAGTAGPILGCN